MTFNGVYGLSRSKHSFDLCSSGKYRPIGLYSHFLYKHRFKPIVARRLVDAIANNRDPKTTKLFDDDEDLIDHSTRIECPFRRGMIHLFDCEKEKQSIRRVPCARQSIPTLSLRSHLKHSHHLSEDLAAKLAQHCKHNRTNK